MHADPDAKPAYHQADEEWTDRHVVLDVGGRPVDFGQARIKIAYPFWRDKIEQAIYEAAVSLNPRGPGEGPFSYIRRISAIVTGEIREALKSMPHVRDEARLPYKE